MTAIRRLRSDNRKSKIQKRPRRRNRSGLVTLIIAFVICGVGVEAQQPTKIPRIGYVNASSASLTPARIEAFRRGMRELGYVEGKNIVIEWRFADGKLDRLPAACGRASASQGRHHRHGGPTVTRPAKEATSTIPIVMTHDDDPVGTGFVASLARPGGNITGLSTLAPELSGKRLEILKEIVPRLSRVAVLGTSTEPGNAQTLKEIELAAGAFKVKLQYLDVLSRQGYRDRIRSRQQGAG